MTEKAYKKGSAAALTKLGFNPFASPDAKRLVQGAGLGALVGGGVGAVGAEEGHLSDDVLAGLGSGTVAGLLGTSFGLPKSVIAGGTAASTVPTLMAARSERETGEPGVGRHLWLPAAIGGALASSKAPAALKVLSRKGDEALDAVRSQVGKHKQKGYSVTPESKRLTSQSSAHTGVNPETPEEKTYREIFGTKFDDNGKTSAVVSPALQRALLGGGAFGAATGALASPEGKGMEGALRGALLGGGGAALGQTVGKGLFKAPQKRLQAVKNKAQQHAGRAAVDLKDPVLAAPAQTGQARMKRIREIEEAAQQAAQKNQTGAAMLGGSLGTGVAVDSTQQSAAPPAQNPYRYPMR